MGRRIGDVTVVKDGRIMWPTLFGVVLGVPLYALSIEWARGIQLVFGGLAAHYRNLAGWTTRFVELGLSSPTVGFTYAYGTFAGAVDQFGVAAFVVSAVVASLTTWIVLEGITRVIR